MKDQSLFFGKIKKNLLSLSSAELALKVVKLKINVTILFHFSNNIPKQILLSSQVSNLSAFVTCLHFFLMQKLSKPKEIKYLQISIIFF